MKFKKALKLQIKFLSKNCLNQIFLTIMKLSIQED